MPNAGRTDAFKQLSQESSAQGVDLPDEQELVEEQKSVGGQETEGQKIKEPELTEKPEVVKNVVNPVEDTVIVMDPGEDDGKYPRKKSKAKAKEPRGTTARIATGKQAPTRAMKIPTEDTGSAGTKKIRRVSPKVFQNKLFTEKLFEGGNPKFAGLTKYGLLAMYTRAMDAQDECETVSVQRELVDRGISFVDLEVECSKISRDMLIEAGKSAAAACERRMQQLRQVEEMRKEVAEGMKATGQEDSQLLQGALRNLGSATAGAAGVEPVPTVGSQAKDAAGKVEHGVDRVAEGVVKVADATNKVSEAAAEIESHQPVEKSEFSKSVDEMRENSEHQKTLKEVIDSIKTLDDYHEFVGVVKQISDWSADKGIALYRLMVPVEFRVWATIGRQPSVINYLETAIARKDDKSVFDEPFANVTCIFHQMVTDWCVKNGMLEDPQFLAFVKKRHEVYKDYNGYINERIKVGAK